MPISQTLRDLIFNARADGCVCLLGTFGPDGPNVSPKGSMLVFDDGHLAYWERAKEKALRNLQFEPRVVVVYSNQKAMADGVLPSSLHRFYGVAEVHDSDEVSRAIFARLSPREQLHEGADMGLGVLIRIDRTADSLGKPF